jgi:hypothetical protein
VYYFLWTTFLWLSPFSIRVLIYSSYVRKLLCALQRFVLYLWYTWQIFFFQNIIYLLIFFFKKLNFIILHWLTCVYIVWANFPHLLTSRQNLFYPVLWFCWRENIRDNRKDISCLLAVDKDSYTERFLTLLPCTCVLQPTLVHFFLISLLLPGPLPIMASANLRLLYLLLNREHINHNQVLGFLSFPYFFHACSPLSVWPTSDNITAFVLDL